MSAAHNTPSQLQRSVDKNAIGLEVRNYIIDNFLLGAADHLQNDSQLMEDGILDSTGVMELVAFLESTFGIAITEEEIIPQHLNSLDNISTFIAHKLC
jgi:acyl carrier protein